jgi:hypothetical protein
MSDLMSESPDEHQRPPGRGGDIEICCAFGFVAALFVIPQAFAEVWRQTGSWRSVLGAGFCVTLLVGLIGIWKLRRWAVFMYAGTWVAYEVVVLLFDHWSVATVPIPLLIIAVGFRNLWKMT